MAIVEPQFFSDHAGEHGLPNPDLPLSVKEAYAAAGIAIPVVRYHVAVATPPGPGFCCHCGQPVPEGQHEAAHALAGFEHLTAEDGSPARILVTHCDDCVDGDGCDRDVPGGFCEPVEA